MNQVERWNCPTCLQYNQFSQPLISHDGHLGKCQQCGTKAIRHKCSSNSPFFENIEWLPILMTGIGLACPTCKTTYQIAEKVNNSPDTPEWLKTVATVVGAVAIVVGVIKVGEKIEEAFS
jgi:endogenous inhibitor of DNA gyrase (YacG/DUF329 family)